MDASIRRPEKLTLAEAARFFAQRLPTMAEADLAASLLEMARAGHDPLVDALEPLVRAELRPRRAWLDG